MTQLTCTDRAGRHELTLDLSAFLADDQTDEHAVKLAGEAAERGPGRSSTPPQPPRQDRDIKKRGRDLINAPAEHGMPVTDLQLGRHESRRGSMLCRQRRAHPGRGHPRSLPRPRRPPGHRRRRDTVARHCRFDPRWQRACPAQTPIPGISSATGLPRQATDEDEAVRRTLITRNKEMPAAQQVRAASSPKPPPTRAPKIIVAWAMAWVIDWNTARWIGNCGEPTMLDRIVGVVTDPRQHCRGTGTAQHGALLCAPQRNRLQQGSSAAHRDHPRLPGPPDETRPQSMRRRTTHHRQHRCGPRLQQRP